MDAQAQYKLVTETLAAKTKSVVGMTYGFPCLKLHGTPFVAFYKDHMVFKLDEARRTEALAIEGSVNWDPTEKNKPEKSWIQIPFSSCDKWGYFADLAHEYAKSINAAASNIFAHHKS